MNKAYMKEKNGRNTIQTQSTEKATALKILTVSFDSLIF